MGEKGRLSSTEIAMCKVPEAGVSFPCSKSSRETRGSAAECVGGGGGEMRQEGRWRLDLTGLEGHCRDLGFCPAGNGELLKDFEE